MPCLDITERLEITLDAENRLVDYKLAKLSCGVDIGSQSLLLEALAGLTSDKIILISPQIFINELDIHDNEMRFIYLKHLLAIQVLLETYIGKRQGSADSKCTIESIEQNDSGIEIKSLIKLAIPVDEIEPCGCYNCKDKK